MNVIITRAGKLAGAFDFDEVDAIIPAYNCAEKVYNFMFKFHDGGALLYSSDCSISFE